MTKKKPLQLFEAYGIELEYMIVDRDTLDVRPIADEVFKALTGGYNGTAPMGPVTWSNELALHVLELKCSEPVDDLVQLNKDCQQAIGEMNVLLATFNAKLMPTAAHPWMDPEKESFRWLHDNAEIYEAYDRIFNCKGHGWSNLQSVHINLPFSGDEQFARLHTAIRLLLPVLPALSASSPIIEGEFSGFLDKRLDYYQKNQQLIPSLCGRVIPDVMLSEKDYQQLIYHPIEKDIAPHDPDNILEAVWLNSRGAIARFDRGAIEIRIIDIQECPAADLAISALVIAFLKMLVEGDQVPLEAQQSLTTQSLYDIFQKVIKLGEDAVIRDQLYLNTLGIETEKGLITAGDLWKQIHARLLDIYPDLLAPWQHQLDMILDNGTLASRMVNCHKEDPEQLKAMFSQLADCLSNNSSFNGC
jgi:carboxylate-amine ligase